MLIKNRFRPSSTKKTQKGLFNNRADTYDEKTLNTPFWIVFGEKILQEWKQQKKKNMIGLDVGCGTGRCAIFFSESGLEMVGTDLSLQMLKKAKEKAKSKNVHKNCEWVLVDAENLPFFKIFDFTTSFGTLHHLPTPQKAIEEISRVTKRMGHVHFVEPNSECLPHFIVLFKILLKKIAKKCRLWKCTKKHAGVREHHLSFSPIQFETWLKRENIEPKIKTEAYRIIITPNLFPKNVSLAKAVLHVFDKFCNHLPLIRERSSILVINGIKK
ncbi:MAG: class I SAM-dependent methyltransferase [Promethearchaeota archaeon]